jgi:hypothetical protein
MFFWRFLLALCVLVIVAPDHWGLGAHLWMSLVIASLWELYIGVRRGQNAG